MKNYLVFIFLGLLIATTSFAEEKQVHICELKDKVQVYTDYPVEYTDYPVEYIFRIPCHYLEEENTITTITFTDKAKDIIKDKYFSCRNGLTEEITEMAYLAQPINKYFRCERKSWGKSSYMACDSTAILHHALVSETYNFQIDRFTSDGKFKNKAGIFGVDQTVALYNLSNHYTQVMLKNETNPDNKIICEL